MRGSQTAYRSFSSPRGFCGILGHQIGGSGYTPRLLFVFGGRMLERFLLVLIARVPIPIQDLFWNGGGGGFCGGCGGGAGVCLLAWFFGVIWFLVFRLAAGVGAQQVRLVKIPRYHPLNCLSKGWRCRRMVDATISKAMHARAIGGRLFMLFTESATAVAFFCEGKDGDRRVAISAAGFRARR